MTTCHLLPPVARHVCQPPSSLPPYNTIFWAGSLGCCNFHKTRFFATFINNMYQCNANHSMGTILDTSCVSRLDHDHDHYFLCMVLPIPMMGMVGSAPKCLSNASVISTPCQTDYHAVCTICYTCQHVCFPKKPKEKSQNSFFQMNVKKTQSTQPSKHPLVVFI